MNQAIIGKLQSLRATLPEIPAGDGWQSEPTLHELKEFGELFGHIHHAMRGVLKFLHIGADDLEITGCWANINTSGAAHAIHSHPNNFISGVYYVATHADANTIYFHDPRAQTGTIRPPVTSLTGENTDQAVVKVQDGTLLLFPSWLQHSVPANESKEHRISVSFNAMFSSYTKTMSPPLW